MVTQESGPVQIAHLDPVTGCGPRLTTAAGQLTVGMDGLDDLVFSIGDAREQIGLLTEYRTQVTTPDGVDTEYRGILLRCLDGRAHVWLTNVPADVVVYRHEDVVQFCEQAGLRHDEMRFDYAALLRISAKARRVGHGTGQVSRYAESLGRAGSAFIVLGTLLAFSALALGLIPHPTNAPGPIAAVAVGFIVVVFGFSWLGLRLAARPVARRRATLWVGAAVVALIVTIACGFAGVHLAALNVLATCLIPAGVFLWLIGIPLLPWSLDAIAPTDPQSPTGRS
ncbi:hypothetical protein SAMN05443377_10978 [Propionibacterium cyclohexanicum]|uniref:Uncharacterized protein n=1 Tax=Propionibacterium cyclohexanicum TaxID=64702 RepID=A0A1H9RVM4_9ACTN|nr:hypothetical protein [Propionibacterium cyclohexanicum]SER76687.1 hypothetical protein SAMN05443377_10978 [Propionibacterium cyclohexanicum]